jgi:hypothetical protein
MEDVSDLERIRRLPGMYVANAVPTLEESSHVIGLKRALRRAKWRPAGAAVSVILTSPEYSGPTRQVLNVPGLEKSISDIIATAIKHFKKDTDLFGA